MNFLSTVSKYKQYNWAAKAVFSFNNKLYGVLSDDLGLVAELKSYFKEWLVESVVADDKVQFVRCIEVENLVFEVPFQDYNELGKKRVKEVYADIDDYRLVKKTKTNVHFGIRFSKPDWWALGPLNANPNQLINFITAIFMQDELSSNAMLFHAAAVAKNGSGIVIAAPSGKGKSTTALNLLNAGLDFVSNDRVILKDNNGDLEMIGVPKHPRVNPGTLLNNSKVKHLLKEPARFNSLTESEIWNWEEKYDVLVNEIYGAQKFPLSAICDAVLIIDWELDSDIDGMYIEPIELSERKDLLPAIMKTPSLMTPSVHEERLNESEADYLKFLDSHAVFVLKGKRAPEEAVDLILDTFF